MPRVASNWKSFESMLERHGRGAVIRAEFIKSFTITGEGITVTRNQHGIVYPFCRKLLAAGFDWQRPLQVYRGDVLCLTVESIGEGARWSLAEDDKGGLYTVLWKPTPFATSATDPKILAGIEAAALEARSRVA